MSREWRGEWMCSIAGAILHQEWHPEWRRAISGPFAVANAQRNARAPFSAHFGSAMAWPTLARAPSLLTDRASHGSASWGPAHVARGRAPAVRSYGAGRRGSWDRGYRLG